MCRGRFLFYFSWLGIYGDDYLDDYEVKNHRCQITRLNMIESALLALGGRATWIATSTVERPGSCFINVYICTVILFWI